ncbi:MAG: ABC transporter ATP-binding protein [Lachnospiraceae bacterium]|nr:ABC transporter ATP-binding protein [Lachnospiraceae bacterium]MBR5658813.1 ABC transporter ATP-binding protein [Lachnospiraceae bacterium]
MVICKEVTRMYRSGDKDICALDHVSLSVKQGEYLAVIGKSGSGKSTLLNMIGLTDIPSSGDVELFGRNTKELSEKEKAMLRNKHIGYIYQNFYLEPVYSVFMNVEVPLLVAGVQKSKREERVLEVLKQVGLEERMKHKASQLSGGEKQRVCLARALVNCPEIILADEPCGNLDSENTAMVMDLLDDLHRKGITIILVTHSEEEAKRADRILQLKDGRRMEK